MSAFPELTSKDRASRGKARIRERIERFKELQQKTKCPACLDEIRIQIARQENGLKEVAQAWTS